MGDKGPGDAIDAGQAAQRLLAQLGQGAVIAARQTIANLRNLRFDQVEVIEQPFSRRTQGLAFPIEHFDVADRTSQALQVGGDAWKKMGRMSSPAPTQTALDLLRSGQAEAMQSEPVDSEQHGAHGRRHWPEVGINQL